MTHRWTTRALLLIGLLVATAWSGAASAAPAAGAVVQGPAMWTLRTDTAAVYFLGSFHILPPSVPWRDDPRIHKALAEAQAVLFEVDMDELDKPEVAANMVRRATLPDGKTLREVLTAETYNELTATAGRFAMDMARLEPMQPWLAASGLLVGYMVSKGADPSSGVDSALTRDAKAAGKQVTGLETVDEQLDVLDTLSKEDPDLLITDIHMPGGLSGIELAEHARRIRPELRIVYFSGSVLDIPPGSEGTLLRKPCTLRELQRVVSGGSTP